ncbi:MAG: AraC family transcriptional regulator [Caulobacteraceae bacterium]|jgi:AraC family transcriptional regulator|nr:AraC family transcriptional regulator [Caulobacteraceae bacterium]
MPPIPNPTNGHHPGDEAGLADTLMALLSDAERSLQTDRDGARWSIVRARSLLETKWRHPPERARSAPPAPAKGGLPPRTMRRVEDYIEENLGNPVPIVDLAELCRLSVRHFTLAFTQSFGQPPHGYIVRRRIERANQLMVRTEEPLSQIALDCGLADQSHLTKWFRRLLGVTPSAWRKTQLA